MALTDKQQRFVEEYLVDLNATQSAIRAGYSPDTAGAIGHENLSKPEIIRGIAEAKAERSEATKIDAAYVLRQAVKLHERCMQEVKPVRDMKGQQVMDDDGNAVFAFNTTGAAKALELIGKHIDVSAFEERVRHSGSMGITVLAEDANL